MLQSSQTSFRAAARGLAAASALASASALFALPATAQQVTPVANGGVTSSTDCNTYKPGVVFADTECELLKGRALDAQLARRQETMACLLKIKKYLNDGKISRETVIQYGKERACELAKTLG